MRGLVNIADPQQQCTKVLALLHTSENPQAFVQLYLATKEEPHLQWLIERIDNFTDQSLVDLLQQWYISEPTGEFVFLPVQCNALQHWSEYTRSSAAERHRVSYARLSRLAH